MKKVVVYTIHYCPYCVRAKELLKRRGIPYEEIMFDVDDDDKWKQLYQKSKMRTVPQIFADDQLIGGYNELAALDQRDQLASLKN